MAQASGGHALGGVPSAPFTDNHIGPGRRQIAYRVDAAATEGKGAQTTSPLRTQWIAIPLTGLPSPASARA